MGSFIATEARRKAFMEMANKAVKEAIDLANAKNLPQAYDTHHPDQQIKKVKKNTHRVA